MASGVSTSSFCVSTSFGHVTNTWQDYVFSISDLRTYFQLPVGTFYYRIRSDNDTDNSFSTLSSERSMLYLIKHHLVILKQIGLHQQIHVTILQQQPQQQHHQQQLWHDTTTTSTSLQVQPQHLALQVQPQHLALQQQQYHHPPPPPPPPPTTTTTLYIVVNDDGSESQYTETEVEDGTVKRDEERKENEKLYGCYMTNAQIERGDCDIPEEKEEETIIIIEDEKRDDTEEELFDDDDLVLEVDIDDEIKESKPEEEEIIPDEKIEIDIEKIEEEFKFEEEEIVIEIPEEIEIIIIEEIFEEDFR